ncbi:hypothetical protein [Robertmurraya sp. P23]|uniref:hypothetical protein n=1 Tax=Robertmurraya sp. P23 TaxID=3436931 RepID=UPI003D95CA6A
MNKDEKEQRIFLEETIQMTKEHIQILDKMEVLMSEMREIAQYILSNELKKIEVRRLNNQFNELKEEVVMLEKKLLVIGH